jgi:hypothetical protein
MVTLVAPSLIDWRGENGRLIKNVYPSTQADSPKKILFTSSMALSCKVHHASGIYFTPKRVKSIGESLNRQSQTGRLLIKSTAQNDRAARVCNWRSRV